MAFDQYIADRIIKYLDEKGVEYFFKKMMGGLIFMVNNKMFCGIHIDKKFGDSLLMARIGEEAYDKVKFKKECLPMDFTGRPMRGYVFITPDGFDLENDLDYWFQLCLDFNPMAKMSKKRKKIHQKLDKDYFYKPFLLSLSTTHTYEKRI